MREISGFVAVTSLLPALERRCKSTLNPEGPDVGCRLQAFDAHCCSCALVAINERHLHTRLPDFDEVPIRVADVGADLEAMVLRVGQKLRTSR